MQPWNPNRRQVLAGLAAASAAWPASGQAYPTRPIRLVVPTPPAGGADTLARLVGKKLGELMGQPIVVENRPGAAGNIAAEQVSKMAADGYTLFVGAISMAVSSSLYKNLPFDLSRDFTPLTGGVDMSNVLVAHPSLPVASVRDLIALAKQKPGTIAFASSGNATSGHLSGELFNSMAGVKTTHVPYKGGGPAMNDLVGGIVQISFASPGSAMGFIKDGRLKALGVTSTYRLPQLPDVPTIAEAGLPGYSSNNWYCFVAPKGLPPALQERLSRDLRASLAAPEVAHVLTTHGMDPAPSSPEQLSAFIRSEIDKWAAVVKASNLQPT